MAKVGAVYCVYEASTFLSESVQRIYPLVDKVLFLLNFNPWYGESISEALINTYRMILSMPDPDNKFEILSGSWKNEAEQRNMGIKILKNRAIDWCLIIDDDELFNYSELNMILNMLDEAVHAAYLIYHQIYWKNCNTIIEGLFGSFPTLARTDGIVTFNENRMIVIRRGHTWYTLSAQNIICHHMSYVRSDSDMSRKIQSFSHAKEMISDWYENIWLKWKSSMIDLHPLNATKFKRAISVSESKYYLQPIN